jgi:hypothetical protein
MVYHLCFIKLFLRGLTIVKSYILDLRLLVGIE